ncbi:response regulator transcription factor [Streptomyces coeruleorubidus]|uniref:response regulator transcription factor n=1 Tax=Streptomyces coeruleorubidus TaxID=116188 RepID=UPI0033B606FB
MRQSLRLVIAEDAVLLREGLVHLLERFGHRVLAAVGDGPALLAAAREHRPDLVITDVRMPPGQTDEGLRTARLLQAEQPGLAVLVLSQYVEQTFADELLDDRRDGVGTGYLLKERIGDVEEFADAVTRVAAGATVVDPEVVRQLLARRRDPLDRLTPREREVLALMAEGRSNAAIARRLVVTDAAVAKHIASILQKLDLPPSAPDDHRRVLAVLAYLRAA